MEHRKNYTVCLPDWDNVLPKLCSLIKASYNTGDFNSFEEDFILTADDESYWKASGKTGCDISIKLEKYEGYFFGTLSGNGNEYLAGTSFLWKSYLAQGGNPVAQEKPDSSFAKNNFID